MTALDGESGIGRELRLGVVGMSDGNGHPYSWSAICNGYDAQAMASCPFPVIPKYLAEQTFPEARLPGVLVTHVWTQDVALSRHVAAAARIPHVCGDVSEMLGVVDGLLLARDDAERHLEFAEPFLRAGLPVYVDKPVALGRDGLDALFALVREPWQLFSCSAFRYSTDLRLDPAEQQRIGAIRHVIGSSPKSWARYGVHVIDPVVAMLALPAPDSVQASRECGRTTVVAEWRGACSATFITTGEAGGEISLTYEGSEGTARKVVRNTFQAFRAALDAFVTGIRTRRSATPYAYLRNVVDVIEAGMGAYDTRAATP